MALKYTEFSIKYRYTKLSELQKHVLKVKLIYEISKLGTYIIWNFGVDVERLCVSDFGL